LQCWIEIWSDASQRRTVRYMPKGQETPASNLIFSRRAFMRSFIFGCPLPLENCDMFLVADVLPFDEVWPWVLCRCSGSALKVCKDSGEYAFLESSLNLSLRSLSSTGTLGWFDAAGLCWATFSSERDDRFRFFDGPVTDAFTSSTGSSSRCSWLLPSPSTSISWCWSDESAGSFLFCFAH